MDFICDLINKISSTISREGQAYFEILSSVQKPKQFKLHNFYGNNIHITFFGLIQINRKTRNEYGDIINKLNSTFLKKSRVCIIDFPKNLGGASWYKKAIKKLEKFGDTPDSFIIPDAKGNFPDFGFDFKHAKRNVVLYRGVLTKGLGYDFRGSETEYMTEFLQVYRYINYQIAKSIIRNHIVEQLNTLANKLGIYSKIIVSGLPTENYLKAIQNRLFECDISFEDAIKASEY